MVKKSISTKVTLITMDLTFKIIINTWCTLKLNADGQRLKFSARKNIDWNFNSIMIYFIRVYILLNTYYLTNSYYGIFILKCTPQFKIFKSIYYLVHVNDFEKTFLSLTMNLARGFKPSDYLSCVPNWILEYLSCLIGSQIFLVP